MTIRLVLSMFILAASGAHADIYKLVDENGRVTYSNVPMAGAKVIIMEPIQTVPATKAKEPAAGPTPANFPKVDNATQRNRDVSRKKILDDELKAEEKLLGDAKQALAEGEAERRGDERNYAKYQERVQKLKDTVALHEKNIAALKKEIAGAGASSGSNNKN
ncbi:MAG: DUF4124 domain-containing protein [Burkholderiales bacterium]